MRRQARAPHHALLCSAVVWAIGPGAVARGLVVWKGVAWRRRVHDRGPRWWMVTARVDPIAGGQPRGPSRSRASDGRLL